MHKLVLFLACCGFIAFRKVYFDDKIPVETTNCDASYKAGWNAHIKQEDKEAEFIALNLHANAVRYNRTHVNGAMKDYRPRTEAKVTKPEPKPDNSVFAVLGGK